MPCHATGARGGGRELALFAESFGFAEIFGFAESFAIMRFTVHNRYLLPGTWNLAEIFAAGTRYQAPGTYCVL